jgi:hypothetical protein
MTDQSLAGDQSLGHKALSIVADLLDPNPKLPTFFEQINKEAFNIMKDLR